MDSHHGTGIVKYLYKRNYEGVICLPAEYTDENNVLSYITEDIAYVKKLFRNIYRDASL